MSHGGSDASGDRGAVRKASGSEKERHDHHFISHKLNEVKRISDRITVLKGGLTKGTYLTKDVTEEDISNLMVGREITFDYDKEKDYAWRRGSEG